MEGDKRGVGDSCRVGGLENRKDGPIYKNYLVSF